MNRRLYPCNWRALAEACKARAGWRCEHCGVAQYEIVTSRKGKPYIIYLAACHKYHDRQNATPELLCLCVTCHARLDYEHKQKEARIRLEILKHLRLLIASGAVTIKVDDSVTWAARSVRNEHRA